MASVDPRRTQPFCTPDCDRRCCCTRWPLYQNRFGVYVCEQPEEDTWTPADPLPVSGLYPEHWYRSDQGLWQDAGVTPAVADGDVVGRWEDLTANNDHVNQAAAGNKPTLQNGAGDLLNGYPVIRFDGGNDYLQGAYTTGGQMTQPNTLFAVAALDPTAVNDGSGHVVFEGDDLAHRSMLYANAAATPDKWSFTANVVLVGNATDSLWNIWTVLVNGAGSQFWKAGVSEAAGDAGLHNMDGLTIGATSAGAALWKGDMVELLFYNANLSDADKNTVGQYFAARYALAYADI